MEFDTNYTPEKDKYLIKVVIMGDISVGKTNIIRRILSKDFERTETTIGVEFGYLTINNIDENDPSKKLCIQIWDTSGAEKYRAITSSHIRNADGALLVYDITNQNTFDHINFWYDLIKNSADNDICIFLLGNKSDLINTQGRAVNKYNAQKFIKEHNLQGFEECSALKDENIKSTFKLFYETIYKSQKSNLEQKTIQRNQITLIPRKSQISNNCC